MTTNKSRLAQLESVTPKTDGKIYVLRPGNDFVTCNGVKIPLHVFEKIKGATLIRVIRGEHEKK